MPLVSATHEGSISTIVLTRPEARNALSVDLCEAISAAVDDAEARGAIVVVFRGEGKVFCAGADLAAVSGSGGLSFLPAFETMLGKVASCPGATIASIHGAALGGGLQLATVCDFRVATKEALLGIPSSRLGIVVNFENVARLVLLVGIARAKEILMTGRTYAGTTALEAGLVNEVVEAAKLEEATGALASDVAAAAPLSVRGAKAAIDVVAAHLSGVRRSDPDATHRIDELVAEAYRSADLLEGIAAMAEKRLPRFEGH